MCVRAGVVQTLELVQPEWKATAAGVSTLPALRVLCDAFAAAGTSDAAATLRTLAASLFSR
jgi:hypothetical protein